MRRILFSLLLASIGCGLGVAIFASYAVEGRFSIDIPSIFFFMVITLGYLLLFRAAMCSLCSPTILHQTPSRRLARECHGVDAIPDLQPLRSCDGTA